MKKILALILCIATVCSLFACKETIDCALLLQKLKTLFGIDRVMLA